MFKISLFCFLFLHFFAVSSQRTWGFFVSATEVDYFKLKEGVSIGFTHSKSYKDNNKWQNILQIGYFPRSYSYFITPQNTSKNFFRKVEANNFLFRIGEEYGMLWVNKRTKKFFLGPSLTLNVLGFYEKGESTDMSGPQQPENYSGFSLEMGISPLLFMEYEYIPYKDSFFVRLEGGYIFNPLEEIFSYSGFSGAWILSLSVGYRTNNF